MTALGATTAPPGAGGDSAATAVRRTFAPLWSSRAEPTSSFAPTAAWEEEPIPAPQPGMRDGLIPAPPGASISIGPVKLHAYGLLAMTGGVVGTWIAKQALVRAGIPTNKLAAILVPAAIAAVVGGRLYHVATEWERYKDRPLDILEIWEGGLGIYGGIAAGVVTGAFLARRAGLAVSPLLDAAAIGMPVAQAIGRGGNYMNQELFGAPTDLPWGLQVDEEMRPAAYADRNSFHPTFLYEGAWNVGLATGLFALSKLKRGLPPGALFATYVAGYAAGRFVVEGLRVDPSKEAFGLRLNQWASLAILGAASVATGALLLKGRRLPM